MPIPGLEYVALPREDEPWIVKGILPVGGVMNIYGNPKAGKSFAALQLALAVAGQLPEWLGIPVLHHGPVLYVQLDMARQDWLARYVDVAVTAGYDLTNVSFDDRYTVPYPFNVTQSGAEALKMGIAQMGCEPAMVIVDTFRDAHGGDENDSGVMRNVMTTLRSAIGKSALTIVSHARKLMADHVADIIAEIRGSSAIAGMLDGIVRLYSRENSGVGTLIYKSRAVDQTTVALKRLSNGYWKVDQEDKINIVQEVIKQHPGATKDQQNDIAALRLGTSKSTIRNLRETMGL